MVSMIQKRDGRLVGFDAKKIESAIYRALYATGLDDRELAGSLSKKVVAELDSSYGESIPSVEDVQDVVENVLIGEGHEKTAKAYILYRKSHEDMREAKRLIGVADDLKLGINAVRVLEKRYLKKDREGRVVETPSGLFRRVAKKIASVDSTYGRTREEVNALEEEFYALMTSLQFLPNSPTLMNAGTDMGQLSACFVVPVEDSMESIFDAVKAMALIHQSGGGTGFSFSRLRPEGDIVRSTGGIASGPVSFMRVFDTATDVIKQGGRRRGANMAILRVDHPDILKFIRCKEEGGYTNFNISVGITPEFMEALEKGTTCPLVNPRSGEVAGELEAVKVFDLIAFMAWKTGDPGLVFLDEINKKNPTPSLGAIESTNPCGEQPLLPYESCNLGSVNLSLMLKDGKIDWDKLKGVVRTSVHFLDNVIDAGIYPLDEIGRNTRATRKIGLGVMGFAEMLIKMKIPYDSQEALDIAGDVMRFISGEARNKSIELGKWKGSFPAFGESVWRKDHEALRNATVTTIAPTGSISIIAGCSSGIEPLFAVSFLRNVLSGTRLLETNETFCEDAKKGGFYSKELMAEIAESGTVAGMGEIPEEIRAVYKTAHEIGFEAHVRMQARFQEYTDNAVSKTINLPRDATPEDVKAAYLLARRLGCKGLTVYRYESKGEQVLYLGLEREEDERYVSASPEYAGGCSDRGCGT